MQKILAIKKGEVKLIIERIRSERVKKNHRKHMQKKRKSSELQRIESMKEREGKKERMGKKIPVTYNK